MSTQAAIKTFGMKLQPGWTQDDYYLFWFGRLPQGEDKLRFWKMWVQELWPEPSFMWDEWCDLYFGALCGAKDTVERVAQCKVPETPKKWWREVTSSGAASTGKSSKAALWVLGNYLCAPIFTSCILTSTSLDQLKRRIWAELCDWISKCKKRDLPIHIVESDTEIRWKGDKKNKRSAIFGIAVKSGGNPQEAVDRIKGIHNRRVFVVVDEGTAVPPAITDACANLDKGTIEFQMQMMGNAVPGENQHTQYCEPEHGYVSVTVDDQFWLTKMGGCCIHFDGHRSPALRDPKKFYFYINAEQMARDEVKYGGKNTPQYWTNDRGFWPPVGLSNTVMDLAMLNQFRVSEPAIWQRGYEMGAAFDPAFEGGDRAVLYPFKLGLFSSGVTGIEFQAPIIVGVDISQDKRWLHYQLADAVKGHCEGYKDNGVPAPIKPANFIMDVTGEGGGLFSILSGRWSPDILPCEFGGAAEKVQIAPDRPTTYHEEYANKVTMLWYVLRRFIEGGQVRGLSDSETRGELTSREREVELKNGRIKIQSKSQMKGMKHSSPDKADACVLASEFMRRKGITPSGQTGGVVALSVEQWNKFAEKTILETSEEVYQDADSAYA